jgi:hypothetical protein
MNINEKINVRGALEQWMKNTNNAIGKSAQKRELHKTGGLQRNRTARQSGLGDAVHRFTFTIPIYAMFLDMAVAKGHKFGARTEFMEQRKLSRALGQRYAKQPKLYKNQFWLNKVIYGRVLDLARIESNIWGLEFQRIQIPERIEFSI